MSTVHEEREAFALLDEAIDALFAIASDPDSDQNAVPVDARQREQWQFDAYSKASSTV